MKICLQFDLGEGPRTVTTTLEVIVAWERKFKRKASELATGLGIEDLLFLAWKSALVHGVTVPLEFDAFIKKCDDIEVVGDETVRPT
jgi:hypothetical protein